MAQMKDAKREALESLELDDRETLVRCFQKEHGLVVDGWAGAVTMEVLGVVSGYKKPVPWRDKDDEDRAWALSRIERARSVIGEGIKYKLGRGGRADSETTPARKGLCDCSGLAAWIISKDRKHEFGRHSWISTDSMLADARSHQDLFKAIDEPTPGCFVVYGRKGNRVGHVALVTGLDPLTGIDCSSSVSKRTGSAISERNIEFFLKRDHQFMVPRE